MIKYISQVFRNIHYFLISKTLVLPIDGAAWRCVRKSTRRWIQRWLPSLACATVVYCTCRTVMKFALSVCFDYESSDALYDICHSFISSHSTFLALVFKPVEVIFLVHKSIVNETLPYTNTKVLCSIFTKFIILAFYSQEKHGQWGVSRVTTLPGATPSRSCFLPWLSACSWSACRHNSDCFDGKRTGIWSIVITLAFHQLSCFRTSIVTLSRTWLARTSMDRRL